MMEGGVSSVPAPLIVQPSLQFDQVDLGRWSTFNLTVGTPPQSFRVLPSTVDSEVWVPVPEGCAGAFSNLANCGYSRGANSFDGVASSGFQVNASSTWNIIGIYDLTAEQALVGSSEAGLYGQDTVGLLSSGSEIFLQNQTVAGIATPDFWMGTIGLGIRPGNFSVRASNIPSLVETLKTNNNTPSLSYGYTAGAAYSQGQTPGSLVIGGFDQARLSSSGVFFSLDPSSSQSLSVDLESIVAVNTLQGDLALLQGGTPIFTVVDSTVPHIWLPQTACDTFEQAFGLQYDSSTDLYLINDTIRSQLQQLNASVTFTIGNSTGGPTTNIELPYAAFDMQASLPYYNQSTNCFPIRRAANSSQYTLGRTFLQEAYIVVDWERQNFTIGQAIHQNSTVNIVPILPPSATPTPPLGTGAIAGIAIAVAASIVAAVLLLIWRVRRQRHRTMVAKEAGMERLSKDEKVPLNEANGEDIRPTTVHELEPQHTNNELDGTPSNKPRLGTHEMQGGEAAHEMDGSLKRWSVHELP